MCPDLWKSKDNFEYQLATNHLGHFLLTHLLMDKIKASSGARIVNLSSVAHVRGQIQFENLNLEGEYTLTKAYSQSKLANVLFTNELQRRLKGSNVNVYAVHPGIVKSDMKRHFTGISKKIAVPLINFMSINADLGAQTSLHCALSNDTAHESGFYYK